MTTKHVGPLAAAVAVALIATAIAGAAGQDKKANNSSVAGKWTLKVEGTPHGAMTMGLTLQQKEHKLTGTFASPHGDLPVEGEFVNGQLALSTTTTPTITFKGKVQDDGTLTGYLSSEMGDMTWTATRAQDTE